MKFVQLLLATAVAVLLLGSCSPAQTESGEASVAEDVDVDEFERLIRETPGQLIDVRTPGEVATGYIPGAGFMNFHDPAFENQLNSLDKQKPVYVYCASGGRSGKTMEILKQKEFREIYNLSGGFNAWETAGKPQTHD